ncbi:MAG: LysR substrate-binding domain-containing protein [Pseudomonadota bacterium]|jgi:LysR family glycine cleavage system transcriptional activator
MSVIHLTASMLPTDPLPPLAALEAFEAAARLGSFQAAAHEMRLTPSAVSHRIRALEAHLGQALFVRGHRRVELTHAGRTLQDHVGRAFLELRQGTAALRRRRPAGVLRVSAAPAFANAFLTRRVAAFEQANRPLELRIEASNAVVDLDAAGVDVAIRLSAARPSGADKDPLLQLVAAPVCSPAQAEGLREGGWDQATRLCLRLDPRGWRPWLRAAGLEPECGRELWYDSLNDSIQGALAGVGVALAPLALVAGALERGQLVAASDLTVESKLRYWFVCRRTEAQDSKIARFRRWLKAEIAA